LSANIRFSAQVGTSWISPVKITTHQGHASPHAADDSSGRATVIAKRVIYLALLTCLLHCATPADAATRATVRDGYVTLADGTRIRYLEAGTGTDAPTLIFIPGFLMPAMIWKEQLEAFAGQGRTIAIDPRSQGESTKTADGNTPEVRAQDLRELLGKLGLSHVVLIGWSQGVQDVAAYVEQFGSECVAGFVLVDAPPSAGPTRLETDPQASKALLGRLAFFAAQPREYVSGMMARVVRKPLPESERQFWIESALKTPTSTAISMLVSDLLTVDRRPALRKFDKPTLVVASSASSELALQQEVAQTIRDAEFLSIEDAGHAVFVDQPVAFNRAVAAFIQKNAARMSSRANCGELIDRE
jgi:microsomal epoxide hydrolase